MQSKNYIYRLIINSFSEESSVEEECYIKNWIEQSDKNRALFNELKEIWSADDNYLKVTPYRKDVAWAKFMDIVNRDDNSLESTVVTPKIKLFSKRDMVIKRVIYGTIFAAMIALLITTSLFYIELNYYREPSKSIISCENGDRSKVLLPDGSEVWLNSGTTLCYDANFSASNRKLELDGEAYFNVAKDSSRPFVITTNSVEVEVLGTQFVISSYSSSSDVSTTVKEGVVSVSSIATPSDRVRIVKNERAVYDKTDGVLSMEIVDDVESELAWLNGRLTFSNESLFDVEERLERWFDVDIDIEDKRCGEIKFTGILDRESILKAASYFALSDKIDYIIEGNTIIFSYVER